MAVEYIVIISKVLAVLTAEAGTNMGVIHFAMVFRVRSPLGGIEVNDVGRVLAPDLCDCGFKSLH